MSDPVAELHRRLHGRTAASAWFDDIFLLLNEEGVLAKDIQAKLKVFTATSGKTGIAVVFDRPLRDVEATNLPGPEWEVRIPVVVYEMALLNRSASGTGKQIEEVISRVASLLHLFLIQDLGTCVYLDNGAVTPFTLDQGVIGAEVMFRAQMNQRPESKVGAPKVEGTLDAVTISAGARYGVTEGAVVYYTTDGTYPSPTNGTLYGTILLNEDGTGLISEDGQPLTNENTPAPFVVAAGTVVLANAWKPDMQHSDLAGKQF